MKGDYLAEQGVLLSHLFPLKINNRLRFVLKLPLKLLDSSSFGLDLLPQAILLGLVLSLGAQQFLTLDLELSLELADPGLKSKDVELELQRMRIQRMIDHLAHVDSEYSDRVRRAAVYL